MTYFLKCSDVPAWSEMGYCAVETARRLGVAPERCAAIEDSANGIRAARAAGMYVIAIPNRRYPPPADALELADVVLGSIAELTPTAIDLR